MTTITCNCDLTQKTPLCHSVGTFCVTLLTSRSFLRRAQSLNCAHNGVKEQLLTCQLQDCEPRCLLKKALCCRWQLRSQCGCELCATGGLPWCRCTSAPEVPEGLWSGCASTAGAFCTLNSVSHQQYKWVIMSQIVDFRLQHLLLWTSVSLLSEH